MDKFELPAEIAAELKKIDTDCGEVLRRLGGLEADFMHSKQRLFEELSEVRGKFKTALEAAATKGGLDLQKERWTLNLQAGVLSKVS